MSSEIYDVKELNRKNGVINCNHECHIENLYDSFDKTESIQEVPRIYVILMVVFCVSVAIFAFGNIYGYTFIEIIRVLKENLIVSVLMSIAFPLLLECSKDKIKVIGNSFDKMNRANLLIYFYAFISIVLALIMSVFLFPKKEINYIFNGVIIEINDLISKLPYFHLSTSKTNDLIISLTGTKEKLYNIGKNLSADDPMFVSNLFPFLGLSVLVFIIIVFFMYFIEQKIKGINTKPLLIKYWKIDRINNIKGNVEELKLKKQNLKKIITITKIMFWLNIFAFVMFKYFSSEIYSVFSEITICLLPFSLTCLILSYQKMKDMPPEEMLNTKELRLFDYGNKYLLMDGVIYSVVLKELDEPKEKREEKLIEEEILDIEEIRKFVKQQGEEEPEVKVILRAKYKGTKIYNLEINKQFCGNILINKKKITFTTNNNTEKYMTDIDSFEKFLKRLIIERKSTLCSYKIPCIDSKK